MFSWNDINASVFVPGNSQSVAKQLMRVTIHQVNIEYPFFTNLYLVVHQRCRSSDVQFKNRKPRCVLGELREDQTIITINLQQTVSTSLMDFAELNPVAFIQFLLDDLVENWSLKLSRVLHNLSAYIQYVPLDLYVNSWGTVIGQLENVFHRYYTQVI